MLLLGLAKRAGKVSCGEKACKDAVSKKKSYLVIVAEDTGKNTLKSISDSCVFYGVTYFVLGNKENLGHALGNSFNAVVSVNDSGLADTIIKHIQANINKGE